MELRLIGEFGLTPPPANAPWRERRRAQELDWQLPVTWGLHWLLRLLTLGLWGRPRLSEPRTNRSGDVLETNSDHAC